jgi:hypothetical protein
MIRRLDMSTKNALALTGLLLMLGAGSGLAQEQKQAQVTDRVRNKAPIKFQDRSQNRMRFEDQNGDGINDIGRDHDSDGIPNCQDPDWTRPKDGTGYQNRNGQGGSQARLGEPKSFRAGRTWSNMSFRNGQKGLSRGVCEGTGPQGKGPRRGRS